MNLLFSASSAAVLHPPGSQLWIGGGFTRPEGGWMHGASFLVTRDRSPPQIGFLAPLPARSEMSECAITLRRQGEVQTGEKKEKGKNQQERPCIPRRGKIRLESAGDPLGCSDAMQKLAGAGIPGCNSSP